MVDEVGYLTYGPDAANVLFHVVNDRHLKKRPMIFTTNKPLNEWGKVLHDEDMAAAILDRVLESGRFIHLDGPSGRTRHLNLEETLPEIQNGSEFPELVAQNFWNPQFAISTSTCRSSVTVCFGLYFLHRQTSFPQSQFSLTLASAKNHGRSRRERDPVARNEYTL